MFECVACTYVYYLCMPGTEEDQKRVSKPLDLELQTVVSSHVVLGTEPASSGRTLFLSLRSLFYMTLIIYKQIINIPKCHTISILL